MDTRTTPPPITIPAALRRAASFAPRIIDKDELGRMPTGPSVRQAILYAVRTACPGSDIRVVNEITDACGDAIVAYMIGMELISADTRSNTWTRVGVGVSGMGMTHVIRLLETVADMQELADAA